MNQTTAHRDNSFWVALWLVTLWVLAFLLGGCAGAPIWGPWASRPTQAQVQAAVYASDQRRAEDAATDLTEARQTRPLAPPTRPGTVAARRAVDVTLDEQSSEPPPPAAPDRIR